MDFRGLNKAIDGLMWLALIGFFAVVIGVPVGLFFLIRWFCFHLQWIN